MILIMINEEKWGEESKEILLILYVLFSIPNIKVFPLLFS